MRQLWTKCARASRSSPEILILNIHPEILLFVFLCITDVGTPTLLSQQHGFPRIDAFRLPRDESSFQGNSVIWSPVRAHAARRRAPGNTSSSRHSFITFITRGEYEHKSTTNKRFSWLKSAWNHITDLCLDVWTQEIHRTYTIYVLYVIINSDTIYRVYINPLSML